MKRNLVCLAIALFVGAFVAACSSDKGPADLAIKAAEEAINAVRAEAVKYMPDEVKSLESALAAVKDKFAKGEYTAAIPEAKSIVDGAKGLVEKAKVKKEELTQSWTDLSQGVPKMVEALQSRVDSLSKSKKLPAELTAEKLAEAKTGVAAAKEEWAKALQSFQAGNLAEAVAAANSVKGKVASAMEMLGMSTQTPEKKAPEKTVQAKAAPAKAPAGQRATVPKKVGAKPTAKASGFVGTVVTVSPGLIAVKSQKEQVNFDTRNPKFKGYKSIREVRGGDTVAVEYTKDGIMIAKLGGPAKAKTGGEKKGKKCAPSTAK